jgi:hypothetical protein
MAQTYCTRSFVSNRNIAPGTAIVAVNVKRSAAPGAAKTWDLHLQEFAPRAIGRFGYRKGLEIIYVKIFQRH